MQKSDSDYSQELLCFYGKPRSIQRKPVAVEMVDHTRILSFTPFKLLKLFVGNLSWYLASDL